jgi:hypothetical protein
MAAQFGAAIHRVPARGESAHPVRSVIRTRHGQTIRTDPHGAGDRGPSERGPPDSAAARRSRIRARQPDRPQRSVMQALFHAGGLSLKELSRAVGLAHSTVSGIVDRLEEARPWRDAPARSRRMAAPVSIVVSETVRDYMRDTYPAIARIPSRRLAPRQTGRARGDSGRPARAAAASRTRGSHGPGAEIVILGLRLYPMANPKYAVSDKPVPVSELVATLSDGTKVKRRVPRMRACNEKDAKGQALRGPSEALVFLRRRSETEIRRGRGSLSLRALQDALSAECRRRAAHRHLVVLAGSF